MLLNTSPRLNLDKVHVVTNQMLFLSLNKTYQHLLKVCVDSNFVQICSDMVKYSDLEPLFVSSC